MPMSAPHPTLADLVFPSASAQPNLNTLLTDLKRANLSIHNRLRSILQDAGFVRQAHAALGGPGRDASRHRADDAVGRPLVANERCGSWYVRPEDKGASAYFKSTDGHDNAWKFSTRRLNLHLLDVIGKHDGCIIVDSTRRGKRMPDALSKTIPIWCAVLNRALFPSLAPEPYHALHTPPQVVSPSERAQISALLPAFLASLAALDLDLPALRTKVAKPLRPFWVTPDTDLGGFVDRDGPAIFEDFHPVVCCTASRRVAGGELTTVDGGHVYVQGAGDDTENWACGLTAELWWANADALLSADEAELPGLIGDLVRASEARALEEGGGPAVEATAVAPCVAVCPLARLGQAGGGGGGGDVLRIALLPAVTPAEAWVRSPTEMAVGLGRHKVASRNLRPALADVCEAASCFFERRLGPDGRPRDGARVVVACESGRDTSVAAALAVSLWCFDGDGRYRASTSRTVFTKDMVKVRLGAVMTAFPAANPGRASLQSVNSFLMDYRR